MFSIIVFIISAYILFVLFLVFLALFFTILASTLHIVLDPIFEYIDKKFPEKKAKRKLLSVTEFLDMNDEEVEHHVKKSLRKYYSSRSILENPTQNNS